MKSPDARPLVTEEISDITVYISVNGNASEEDEHIARWYVLTMAPTKPVASVEQLDAGYFCNLLDAAMDALCEHITINYPDDFNFEAYLEDGRALQESNETSAFKDVRFSLKSGPLPLPDHELPVRIDFVSTFHWDDQGRRLDLIEKHAQELIAPGKWGTRMLNKAAMHGETRVCRALIEKGANITDLDEYGRAPIHSACCFRAVSIDPTGILEMLIEAGAPVNQADRQGRQALHYAAHQSNSQASTFLIEHGAQLNQLDNHGLAPIHIAVNNLETKVLRTLVQAGADIEQRNAKGHTTVEMLLGEKRTKHHIGGSGKCALWLIAKGASVPHQGTLPHGIETNVVTQVSDLNPKMAAVIGGFLPELMELLEADQSSPDELDKLRLCAQEMNMSEAVAMIDSHKARSVIAQVIASARSKVPGSN